MALRQCFLQKKEFRNVWLSWVEFQCLFSSLLSMKSSVIVAIESCYNISLSVISEVVSFSVDQPYIVL